MKKVVSFCNESERNREVAGLLRALFPDFEIRSNPSTPEKVTLKRCRDEASLPEARVAENDRRKQDGDF